MNQIEKIIININKNEFNFTLNGKNNNIIWVKYFIDQLLFTVFELEYASTEYSIGNEEKKMNKIYENTVLYRVSIKMNKYGI